MFSFRPHYIKYSKDSINSWTWADEEDLDLLGEKITMSEDFLPCRFEINQKANTIILTNGEAYNYSYIIYLDLSAPDLHYGQLIRLYNEKKNIISKLLIVQGFSRGQLDCKLWV